MQSAQSIGRYEILGRLGGGGMGEVFRARDTVLGRDVAIKVLPPEFAADSKRQARFEREARIISQLNHPHICTLYDVGHENGTSFLIMELIEGETLARRIARGALPLKDVIDCGIQVADALEQAHRAGIVHRDLKPANVMMTRSGVKLLDFGLSKRTSDSSPDASTMAAESLITDERQIVGTLHYMAPEQLAGEEPDARTDIFALGLLLYEMATGKRAFEGSSKASIIAAILEHDPTPVRELQPATPAALERLIRSCIAKDPNERIGAASDVAIALRWIRDEQSDATTTAKSRLSWVPWSVAVAGLAMAVFAGFMATRNVAAPKPVPEPLRMTFQQITDDAGEENMPVLSPDGKFVAYVSARSGNDDIYLQRIGGSKAVNLTADSPADDLQPAFSRDGQQIAFRSERDGGGIFIMGATGESVKRVSDFGSHPSWSPNGRELVVSTALFKNPRLRRANSGELWIIDVNSGRKRRLTSLSAAGDAVQPSWSPHGERIAFWGRISPSNRVAHIYTVPSGGGKPIAVSVEAANAMNPVWSPDGRYLYFSSDREGSENIWRVPIEEASGKTTADPERLAVPAREAWPLAISGNGRVIAYCARDYQSGLERIAITPNGTAIGPPTSLLSRTTFMMMPDVSPDGSRIAFVADRDIYVAQTDGSNVRQLTTDHTDVYPSWSPDGKRIAFNSGRTGKQEIAIIGADGSGLAQVTQGKGIVAFPKWSPDGSRITTRADIDCPAGTCIVDMRAPFPIVPNDETLPRYAPGWKFVTQDWSPDGKWLLGGVWADEKEPTRMLAYSFETRTYTTLIDHSPLWEAAARWMPDGRRFVFSDGRKIHMMDRVTRERHEVFDAGSIIDGFIAVSKDGRFVYYVRNSEESDVWLMRMGGSATGDAEQR